MRIRFYKEFKKNYQKLRQVQDRVDERLQLFVRNPFHPLLDNRTLQGELRGYRSINITGDYRAIYLALDADTAVFVKLGTHADLYE